MKRNILASLLAIATAFALTACQSPKTAGYSVRAAETGDDALETCLKVDNGSLANALRVASMHTSTTLDGRLKVQVSILNTTRRDYPCQYKFRFFDADDLELSANRPWQSIVFHGGEEARLSATAPDPGSASFQIHVRPLPATRKY